jgi:hypothetical protein
MMKDEWFCRHGPERFSLLSAVATFSAEPHVAFHASQSPGMLLEHAMAAVCMAYHSKHTGCNDSGSTRPVLAIVAQLRRFMCSGWRSVIAPFSMVR